jgi:hypothetical protein
MNFDILITMPGWSNERTKLDHILCIYLEVFALASLGRGSMRVRQVVALQGSDAREN